MTRGDNDHTAVAILKQTADEARATPGVPPGNRIAA
jgi:hypothetical protein